MPAGRRPSASIARSTTRSATAPKAMLCDAARLARGRGHRRHPAHQQEARPKKKLLYSKEDVSEQVVAFDERSEELLGTLAPQAGISLENAMLSKRSGASSRASCSASVEAIESRDPTTSGHSRRVADLTVGLAKAVERDETGPYREVDLHPRRSARDRIRVAAARLRQDRRARAGARQGEEALRRRARAHSSALRVRRARRSRSTCSDAQGPRARAKGPGRRARSALDRELVTRANRARSTRGRPSRAPTSRRC